jgi:hypothetical protein
MGLRAVLMVKSSDGEEYEKTKTLASAAPQPV